MKKAIYAFGLVVSITYADFSQEGLEYLNLLRDKAGMIDLTRNSDLEQSAYNHNLYMDINNIYGHYEDENNDGFTGVAPWDRAFYTGYNYIGVSENLSVGQKDIYSSIDGLFSAIYHRFGFLSEDINEIGLDAKDNMFYNYDMGNTYLNALCVDDDAYSGSGTYYTGLCRDSDKKIGVNNLNVELNKTRNQAPEVIIWPAANMSDVPPVFFEETPDPLPDYSVSGYPVSAKFNVAKVPTDPTVTEFKISNDTQDLELITLMNKDNDPNSHFTSHQFAIFPKQRLSWGTKYNVSLKYEVDGTQNELNWCFSTRSLNKFGVDKFYEITSSDSSVDIVSNKTYAIYFPPVDGDDTMNRYSTSYNTDTKEISFIDSNTIKVKATGSVGDYIEIDFGSRKIKLTIASSDSASIPLSESCTDKVYNKTSFYVAYDPDEPKNYALVMPSVNKIYIHKAGDVTHLEKIDTMFNSFASYSNGDLCFSDFKDVDSMSDDDANKYNELKSSFNIEAMSNKCYDVKYYYIQKDNVDNGVSFMLYYKPQYKLYEGLAGDGSSFKVVKERTDTYNSNSISNEDYSYIKFDENSAALEIKTSCQTINSDSGQCED